MAMKISDQDSFFYNGKWAADSDNILLDCILRLKGETHWTKTYFPSWFLLIAAQELHTIGRVTFTETELADRVKHLLSRYTTFKDLTRQRGVCWDFPSKSIIADDQVWEKIIKKNSLVAAYYYKEEPIYSKLACVFGMEDIKVEDANEVIVISDTIEIVPTVNLEHEELGEPDEEVNSPFVFPRPTVRRKLFEEDTDPTDRESSTEAGIYFIDLTSDGQLRTRVENGRDLPKPVALNLLGDAPLNRSPYASSCGSNSPNGWWAHLGK